MSELTLPLMLDLDVVSLTLSLVHIGSPTGDEGGLAGSIEESLTPLTHLDVERIGDTVVARTHHRGPSGGRVLVAGHVDTTASDLDALVYDELGKLYGPGACDAKGSLAVMLKAALATYARDITFVFYAGAEGDASHGLATLAEARPDLVAVGVAALLEPTACGVATTQPTHPALARLVELAPGTPISPPSCSGLAVLTARGIPTAVFGPGDPGLAHSPGELVPTAELTECEFVLRTWLQG